MGEKINSCPRFIKLDHRSMIEKVILLVVDNYSFNDQNVKKYIYNFLFL